VIRASHFTGMCEYHAARFSEMFRIILYVKILLRKKYLTIKMFKSRMIGGEGLESMFDRDVLITFEQKVQLINVNRKMKNIFS